jgi:hypothetical protein
MNTENLKLILNLVAQAGDGARATFLWYLAYDIATTFLICATWIAVPLLSIKAVFKGIKYCDDNRQ